MITVFTPSYNRKKELKLLYKSLLKQKNCNFEWLIVDDGSTDGTDVYITELTKKNKINIKYFKKKNGGKQSAYNLGVDKAEGEIFICIDSDDILAMDVLTKIEADFKNLSELDAGVAYLQSYINDKTKIIGTKFPQNVSTAFYYDIYGKYKVTGDKLIVLKTKIAKQYPFPIFDEEKFVPEELIFNRIAKKYTLKLSNEVVARKNYLENGYSNNYFNLVKKNPLGNRQMFLEKYYINNSLYNVYGYLLFSFYSKMKFSVIYNEHPSKLKVLIMYIPVWVISKIK